MNRRQFLQVAALLASGATAVPNAWSLNVEQRKYLAAQADYVDSRSLDFFTAAQRASIAAAVEQIIPRTETPGALDAGADRFVELMVED